MKFHRYLCRGSADYGRALGVRVWTYLDRAGLDVRLWWLSFGVGVREWRRLRPEEVKTKEYYLL